MRDIGVTDRARCPLAFLLTKSNPAGRELLTMSNASEPVLLQSHVLGTFHAGMLLAVAPV